MHAWSEVEHDLVYKPLQGALSKDALAQKCLAKPERLHCATRSAADGSESEMSPLGLAKSPPAVESSFSRAISNRDILPTETVTGAQHPTVEGSRLSRHEAEWHIHFTSIEYAKAPPSSIIAATSVSIRP